MDNIERGRPRERASDSKLGRAQSEKKPDMLRRFISDRERAQSFPRTEKSRKLKLLKKRK